jgi:alpha-L-rhamnosidase
VPAPRFSWALVHPTRGQFQSAYHIVVTSAAPAGGTPVVWDSGTVASNKSLNVPYGGQPLRPDADYAWTVTWADSTGALSAPATAAFSTGLLAPADWQGAGWVSAANESSNVYRASVVTLAAQPARARLYISGLGYHKSWLNGQPTDSHELGQFVTFQQRVLYDTWDVTNLLRAGCNQLGVMLGHGWFSQPSIMAGPKQLRALLSVTAPDGTTAYYATAAGAGDLAAVAAAGAAPLTFATAPGPVLADDIYVGETYDGRVGAALDGWSTCGFAPGAAPAWAPAVAPAVSPATFGSAVSAHHVQITTDRTFSVVPNGLTQPSPGVFVFDVGQNMAGQTTLRIEGGCPAGTVVTLKHAEILDETGHIHNNYLPKVPMQGTYVCAGTGGLETYRTHFSYYGFRYVQLEGFPGVPGESAVTAHFVHSDVPQSGEFLSSSSLLNAIQHATRYASWSNLMDIPTDCPQRERRGWLGDAQLSFETVIHNVDGGAFYAKWLQDFIDAQVYDNATLGTNGALPDCVPYYGHGHPDSDPGWGIAGFSIPDWYRCVSGERGVRAPAPRCGAREGAPPHLRAPRGRRGARPRRHGACESAPPRLR